MTYPDERRVDVDKAIDSCLVYGAIYLLLFFFGGATVAGIVWLLCA